MTTKSQYHFLITYTLILRFENLAHIRSVVHATLNALMRKQHTFFIRRLQILLQPFQLFLVYESPFFHIHIIICFSIMNIFFSIIKIISIQYDKMEISLIKRIIASRHFHPLDVFFGGIFIHIMIADDMIFITLEAIPEVTVDFTVIIQPAKIA